MAMAMVMVMKKESRAKVYKTKELRRSLSRLVVVRRRCGSCRAVLVKLHTKEKTLSDARCVRRNETGCRLAELRIVVKSCGREGETKSRALGRLKSGSRRELNQGQDKPVLQDVVAESAKLPATRSRREAGQVVLGFFFLPPFGEDDKGVHE
jgi:hypothetical protein